jgi:hypothetical protein
VQQHFQQQLELPAAQATANTVGASAILPVPANASSSSNSSGNAGSNMAGVSSTPVDILHLALQYGGAACDSLPPTHPAYAWYYAAFVEAAKEQEVWQQGTQGVLKWLDKYRAQVRMIAANPTRTANWLQDAALVLLQRQHNCTA